MDKINSLRRTKSRINDIIRCNLFELFVTWTFAKDRYDIAKNKQKLEDWLKNQQKRIGAFEYVVVPELHKDGAIHFHGLLKGYKGEITPAIHNGKQLIKRGKKLYNFKGYKSGFSTIEHIGDTEDDQQKAGRYIQKYISKGFLDIPNQKRYWHSRGLRKPLKENNPTWYKDKTPIFTKKNDYGIYMLFDDFVAPDGWELKD